MWMNCKMRKIVIFALFWAVKMQKNGGFLRFFVVKRPGWGEKWGVFRGIVTCFTCELRVFYVFCPAL